MKAVLGYVFLAFFSVYFFLGLWGSGYNNRIYTEYDLFYDIDSNLQFGLMYMKDLTNLDRHPFAFLILPVLKVIEFLFGVGERGAVLLAQAMVGAFNNILLFLILKKIKIKPVISVLFTLIYGFGFSTLVFVSFPEIYVYSSLIGLMFLYAVIAFTQNKSKASWGQAVLAILACAGLGINLINIVLYLPMLVYYFLKKKRWKYVLIFIITEGVLLGALAALGETLWGISGVLMPGGELKSYPALEWFNSSRNKFMPVFQETWIAPFYALDTFLIEEVQRWRFLEEQSILLYIPFVLLILGSQFYRYMKKVPAIIFVSLGVVVLHMMLNCFYNTTWFLYAQNYFFYLIVFLAYFYSKTNHKVAVGVLGAFLAFEIFLNFNVISVLINWLNVGIKVNPMNILSKMMVILILAGLGEIVALYHLYLKKKK